MNMRCPHCQIQNPTFFAKDGHYIRRSDSRKIQRYRCKGCKKRFSRGTFSMCYRQKKRHKNDLLLKLYSSGLSLRRIALVLKLNKNTVERKVEFLAVVARKKNQKFLHQLKRASVTHLQFDDLITCEHTKLKPCSVSIAVDADRRFILGMQVSQIPAFGKIAAISRKKYGRRKSYHREGLTHLFARVSPVIHPKALIRSDQHKLYPEFIQRFFPAAKHERFKGGRGCIVGQGELKKLHHDPIFVLNHTCAMLRENLNRLKRKTWALTKDRNRLQMHLEIFMYYYNQIYLPKKLA